MRVAYLGNFRPAHSTENDVVKALKSLGHEVVLLQEDETSWGDVRERVLESEPDLFLYTRTWGRDPAGGRWFMEWAGENRLPTASFHLDLYVGLDREVQITSREPFWLTDMVFTADGGHDGWFAEHGIRHYWLAPAVAAENCVLAKPNGRFRHDLLWVGSWQKYHAEYPFRFSLVSHLRRSYRNRIGLYPAGRYRPLRGDDLAAAYRSATVVIGDSLCLPGTRNYWSDRIPETLGRGGLLIFPRVPGLEDHYTDGEHYLGYEPRDLRSVVSRIEEALAMTPEEREEIALAGHEHVKATATYTHRMREMFAVLAEERVLSA